MSKLQQRYFTHIIVHVGGSCFGLFVLENTRACVIKVLPFDYLFIHLAIVNQF